jgi:biotin carboxylase
MMNQPYILYVNLRRIVKEGYESLLAAKQLGYDVILMTNKEVPPFAREMVSHVVEVDTYNHEEAVKTALELSEDFSIKGVACWTEIDVELVAKISSALKLPGLSPEVALHCRNKYEMRNALLSVPEVLPLYKRVTEINELKMALTDIGYPAILKPTGASGSKGIFKLENSDDMESAFLKLQRIAQPDYDPVFRQFGPEFIVEEYVEGHEYSIEGFVSNGKVEVICVIDKLTTEPYHLEYRHITPPCLEENAMNSLTQNTIKVVKTLGLSQCAFHLEAKLSPKGFKLIEVAARPAGGYLSSHLIPLSTGIDFFKGVVKVSLGEELSLVPQKKLFSGIRFILAEEEGTFKGIQNMDQIISHANVEHLFLEQTIGTEIELPPKHFGKQVVAAVVAKGLTYDEVELALEDAARECKLNIENKQSMESLS